MFKVSFKNGVNISTSFNLLNVSFKFWGKDEKSVPANSANLPLEELIKPKFIDFKTTFSPSDIGKIHKISSEVNAYLFIEKETKGSDWNIVIPVLHEKETNRIFQFGWGNFAIEGCGGGLSNTRKLIRELRHLETKGIQVRIIPRVIDNTWLKEYEYVDSGVTLSQLIEKSIDLEMYRKGSHEWIYKNLDALLN